MLQFESGPSDHLLIQNHLGLPATEEEANELKLLTKRRIFHAQRKAKNPGNSSLTRLKLQKQPSVLIPMLKMRRKRKTVGTFQVDVRYLHPPAWLRRKFGCSRVHLWQCKTPGVWMLFCALRSPWIFDSHWITVSYYEKSTVGDYYTVYDPPLYVEKYTKRECILTKLSHPTPKGTRTISIRELSMTRFSVTELSAAIIAMHRNNSCN